MAIQHQGGCWFGFLMSIWHQRGCQVDFLMFIWHQVACWIYANGMMRVDSTTLCMSNG
jgi:hypothetical protein